MKYILALDQGTTSTRAIVFAKSGEIISSAQQEFRQIYPKAGWVEHSPQDIMGSTVAVISEALVRANLTAADIAAMGITNQRETTLVWDKKTGKPVCNAIVWQCRRTADFCERLKREGFSEKIYNKTGLVPDAYFSATKIKWILDNVEGARERAERGELLFGTIDTFILWQLSKGRIFATDYTNASRTMLFNIHTLKWDNELLRLFDIPSSMLPEVHPSGHIYGETDAAFFGSPVPVCGVVGDQQSALFGQLCTREGDVKNTYGTGCFLLMNTGRRAVKSRNGLVTTLGACLGGKPDYVLEGSVFVGGAVVQWLRDELKVISSSEESETQALSVKDSGGVYVVPAFTGLGAPYWDAEARGTIVGITRGTSRAQIIRAALEGIAYEVCDLVQAMEKDAEMNITRLAVDGGASKNEFLMQFQADILNCEAVRPELAETTALGAAYLAGLCCGFWSSTEEIKSLSAQSKIYSPKMTERKRLELLDGWRKAVRQTRQN
ncbi:MAG: glycerol kinase GlpK [Clostridia bacterium]|nr:glycerol kinase GlpK [Clostridia bacterium]